ncbi:MAG: hypothetical protein AAB954_01280 [Patescibacteria group bacterium]
MRNIKYGPLDILNNVVFPCAQGVYLISERPALEGVHAVLCAKEIAGMLNGNHLTLSFYDRENFETHNEGKDLIANWAKSIGLDFAKEVDISIGVADVLVYADDLGIFEIGTTRPTKMLLLLKYIAKQDSPYTVHFWPYGTNKAIIFKNWK